MSFAVVRKSEEEDVKPQTITQYWICEKTDKFRKGAHVYKMNGETYVVSAYCSERKIAIGMCFCNKMIAIIEVHNYTQDLRLAHKKNWTFLAWILPYKRKRLG